MCSTAKWAAEVLLCPLPCSCPVGIGHMYGKDLFTPLSWNELGFSSIQPQDSEKTTSSHVNGRILHLSQLPDKSPSALVNSGNHLHNSNSLCSPQVTFQPKCSAHQKLVHGNLTGGRWFSILCHICLGSCHQSVRARSFS